MREGQKGTKRQIAVFVMLAWVSDGLTLEFMIISCFLSQKQEYFSLFFI